MGLFGSRDKFCTNCGKELKRNEIVCTRCRNVIDNKKTSKRDKKSLEELSNFTDSTLKLRYSNLLRKHGLGTNEDQRLIKERVEEDIINMHLAPYEVKPRLMHHIEIRKEEGKKYCPVCGQKAKRNTMLHCDSCGGILVNANNKEDVIAKSNLNSLWNIESKISLVTGKLLSESPYFIEKKKQFNVNISYKYFKKILKAEVKSGHLKYEDIESRLDELLEINDPQTLYEMDLAGIRHSYLFKTKDDVIRYIGYGSIKSPIPINDDIEWGRFKAKADDIELPTFNDEIIEDLFKDIFGDTYKFGNIPLWEHSKRYERGLLTEEKFEEMKLMFLK